jgi:hypothetical protein
MDDCGLDVAPDVPVVPAFVEALDTAPKRPECREEGRQAYGYPADRGAAGAVARDAPQGIL